MKKWVVIFILLVSSVSSGHSIFTDTLMAERIKGYEGQTYVVVYRYSTTSVMIPATYPAGSPHYSAGIKVYKIEGATRVQVGEGMGGYYVEGGCFEDEPEIFIKRALKK